LRFPGVVFIGAFAVFCTGLAHQSKDFLIRVGKPGMPEHASRMETTQTELGEITRPGHDKVVPPTTIHLHLNTEGFRLRSKWSYGGQVSGMGGGKNTGQQGRSLSERGREGNAVFAEMPVRRFYGTPGGPAATRLGNGSASP